MLSPWKRLTQTFGLRGLEDRTESSSPDRNSIELCARVVHEARQPLAAARAAFELLRRSTDDAQRNRAYAVIERQFERLTRVVDDLLEAARIHLGKVPLQVQQLDLRSVVEDVAESVRPQVVEKNQRLTIHVPPEPVWMNGDGVRLEQVVSNLVVNGIKYTDRGGRVSICLTLLPKGAELRVSDTGRGISGELLPHIFEPFVRGDTRSQDGLGVGLAIARQFVELHHGTIRALSAGAGNGSEFIVTLPASSTFYRPAGAPGPTIPVSGPGPRS